MTNEKVEKNNKTTEVQQKIQTSYDFTETCSRQQLQLVKNITAKVVEKKT